MGFPGGSAGKESAWNARDLGLTHSSILAWEIPWAEEPEATVHGVTKHQTRLSN